MRFVTANALKQNDVKGDSKDEKRGGEKETLT
jgi:hypothetical protein